MARRAAIYKAIGPDGLALLQGAPAPSGYTRFRQSNEFYYVTGIEVPHAYMLLDGATSRATLYLPHRNDRREMGEGKVLSAEDATEIQKLSGIDAWPAPICWAGPHASRARAVTCCSRR
jgi:Xaa-Pro aminopeptidase